MITLEDPKVLETLDKCQSNSTVSKLCASTILDLRNVVKDLGYSIEIIIEAFLRAVNNRFVLRPSNSSLGNSNRDAATLFTARRIVDDLLIESDFSPIRSTAFCRRLLSLCRLLASRINVNLPTGIDILQISSFSDSLLEMLVQFRDHLNTTLIDTDETVQKLKLSVDRFNTIVVRKLAKIAVEWKKYRDRIFQQQISTNKIAVIQPSIKYLKPDFTPKGFLLPLALREKRKKIENQKIRWRNVNGSRTRDIKTIANRIESKWEHFINSEIQQVMFDSIGPESLVETGTNSSFDSGQWLRSIENPTKRFARKIVESTVNRIIEDIDPACDYILNDVYGNID